MRFTPTSKYLILANGLSKSIDWKVYIKKTTDISEALSTGTWVDVSDRINLKDLPAQQQMLEYEIGQLTSNSLSFECSDIAWWKANVLNATSSQYIDLKVQFILEGCSDTVYTFSGFVDKLNIPKTEFGDSVSFTAYTAQDMGMRIAAENITTQYVDKNADGAGTAGIILQDIRGMYVINANVASYQLKAGVHSIIYDYNGGTEQACLDSGRYVALSNGANTLGNAADAADDDQRIVVYVPEVNDLPETAAPDTIIESIIVTTPGDTLPKQWYKSAGTRYLLKNIFSKLGITSLAFDTLEMTVAPSPAPGVAKVSFIDNPPSDNTITGEKWAIANDGTDLFIAVGERIYRRSALSEDYTLLATLSAGDKVTKLIYNARNGHLWIFYGAGGNGKLRRLVISGLTLSSEVVLSSTTNITWHNSIEVIDFNYTGSSYLYGVIYTDGDITGNGRLRLVDGSALTISTIFSGTDYGFTTENIASHFMFIRNGGEVWFKGTTAGGGSDILCKAHVSGAGAWVNDGQILTGLDPYTVAAFHVTEDRIYYFEPILSVVKSHTVSSATITNNLTNTVVPSTVESMLYANGEVFFTLRALDPFIFRRFYYLYKFSGNPAVDFQDYTELFTRAYTQYSTLTYYGGILYGIDVFGRLFQYSTTLKFYVNIADFTGTKITDALYKTLKAFLLIGTINSFKQGRIYRRGNAAGVPQTSGNSMSLSINEVGQIVEENSDYCAKFDWVEISNGTVTYSFDGTTYNTKVLSDARQFSYTNELIPDEIVQDVCYYAYQFFKTDRVKYTFNLGIVPLFQYEPFDGADVTFNTTKVQVTGSGVIYGTNIMKDGSMEVEVLI